MLADLEQKWGMTLLERSKKRRLPDLRWGAGQAVFAAGAQRKSRGLRLAGARSCADIHFTAWEDFAITAMVERGLGVSILPGLILQRIPYKIEIRSCSSPITTQSALL